VPPGLSPPVRRGRGGVDRRRSVLTTIAGATAVTAVLAYVLADRQEEFGAAFGAAPLGILAAATALQLLALLSRSEAWRICVKAAGGTVGRRRLYRAASLGYLGSQLNSQLGTAARIGALRRAAPDECPRVPALIAAEVPILAIEAALAALASFTLVGPLGLPWWLPLVLLVAAVLLLAGLRKLASRWRGVLERPGGTALPARTERCHRVGPRCGRIPDRAQLAHARGRRRRGVSARRHGRPDRDGDRQPAAGRPERRRRRGRPHPRRRRCRAGGRCRRPADGDRHGRRADLCRMGRDRSLVGPRSAGRRRALPSAPRAHSPPEPRPAIGVTR
jgi:hypothetical protein